MPARHGGLSNRSLRRILCVQQLVTPSGI
jgi:hypothetical protein